MAKVETTIEEKGIYTLRSGEIANIDSNDIANDKELIVRLPSEGAFSYPKVYLGNYEDGFTKLHGLVMNEDLAFTMANRRLIYTGTSLSGNPNSGVNLDYNGPIGENIVDTSSLINLKLNIVAKSAIGIEASTMSVQLYKDDSNWKSYTSKTIEYSSIPENVIGDLSFSIDTETKEIKIKATSKAAENVNWKVEITSFLQI